MNNQIFNEIQERQQNNNGQPFWGEFAKKYGYTNPEKLRAEYRREKAKRSSYTVAAEDLPSNLPKILLFDIETSAIKAWTFGLWNQNIRPEKIIQDWYMISWSAKWLYSSNVMSDVLTSKEAINCDDGRIVRSLWELMNQADVVIGHNSKGFDIPRSNARFLCHGLQPPHYSKVIDTLEVAKKNFGFSSNSLDYLCSMLRLDGKKETNFELWVKCMAGDQNALKEMVEYNQVDVQILEELYVAVRGWIKPHLGYGLWDDEEKHVCPNCGGEYLNKEGHYFTPANKYVSYRCEACGCLSRGKESQLGLGKRKSLLM